MCTDMVDDVAYALVSPHVTAHACAAWHMLSTSLVIKHP